MKQEASSRDCVLEADHLILYLVLFGFKIRLFATYCGGVRSACLGVGRKEHMQVAKKNNTKPGRRSDECMGSELRCRDEVIIRWRGVFWFWFLLSSCLVSPESALIRTTSPVSRLSSSRNYILLPPSGFVSSRFSSCFG